MPRYRDRSPRRDAGTRPGRGRRDDPTKLPETVAPTELALRVARAATHPRARRTLLLDVDGTLAPIAPTPDAARVLPLTLDALDRLIDLDWTVAVVSGRPDRELRGLVPNRRVRRFGSHGLEGAWTGDVDALDPDLGQRLASLARSGRRLAAAVPGTLVEQKPAGLAFHDRGVARGEVAGWRRRLDAWLAAQALDGLERLDGRRVVELRPRGADKGRVVRRMPVRRGAPVPDLSLLAIGDDRTDEDLFRALEGRGLSVRVGRPGVESCADLRLPSPLAVGRFLDRLSRTGS